LVNQAKLQSYRQFVKHKYRYQVPRICYINKMDRVGANFDRTISMIETRLQANPLPIQYPLNSEESFQDVIDIIDSKVWRFTNDPDSGPKEIPVPDSEKARINDLRHSLIAKIAEHDDEMMVAYIEGHEVKPNDLKKAFDSAYNILKPGGNILVLDVPKESSYAMLYNLAMVVKSWDHQLFRGIKPPNVYPIEFVLEANWRTTEEKVELLKQIGFTKFAFAQTLTRHPRYSNDAVEQPVPGYDRGDYVAIQAEK